MAARGLGPREPPPRPAHGTGILPRTRLEPSEPYACGSTLGCHLRMSECALDPGLTIWKWAPGSQNQTPRVTRSVCLAGAELEGLLKPSGPHRPGPANSSLTDLHPRERCPATWPSDPNTILPVAVTAG